MIEIKNLRKTYGKKVALKVFLIHLKMVFMVCSERMEPGRVH